MDFQTVRQALEKKRYTVSCFQTGQEAADYLCREIRGTTVGLGGSMTLQALQLRQRLEAENEVADHSRPKPGQTEEEARRQAAAAEIYLTSVNGLAESGELVNIDGYGNRVGSTLYGHRKVYFVVGINKLESTLEKAVWRARNVAGPKNAQRLNRKTPCALRADRCYDCDSPERICNGLVILYRKMNSCDMEVVLVEEELGY